MTWFKVDDNLAFHAKVVAAGNAAMGLWVRAGSWASQQLTDGHIPRQIAQTLGTKAEVKRLCDARLWVETDAGYDFWQWNDAGRQPSRVQVEADREAARERQRKARDAARRGHAVTSPVTHGAVTPAVTVPPSRPVPTRPVPDESPAEVMSSTRQSERGAA